MMALNGVWLLLQFPIITGPPATAMVYALAAKTHNSEYWGPQEAWQAFRRLFLPAWKWAALNAVLIVIAAVNILTYRQASAPIWQVLRVVWIVTSFVWMTMNLFYWPFWLAQKEHSMRTTYLNCGRFLLLHLGPSLVLGLFCLLLALAALASAIPLVLGLICWLALIGVVAVQSSLAGRK